MYWDDNAGLKYGWNRDFKHDRMFMWSKRGHVVTKYSLADPEFGDKFVIGVASDKRFGTPVFSTKGGRSMCRVSWAPCFVNRASTRRFRWRRR